MQDIKYQDIYQKRIKGIVDFYGHKMLYMKTILDLGCYHGDVGGALHRLGADVTGVDARQENLKIAGKKYQGLKTIKADLDRDWSFGLKKFDIILDLDLVCHLRDYEAHLRSVCSATTHLILETAVCDSDDPYKYILLTENKNILDLSVNGVSCRPSAAAIERILKECGMNFKRCDDVKYNSAGYQYDWVSKNDNSCDINKRRIWFAIKESSPIKMVGTVKPPISPALQPVPSQSPSSEPKSIIQPSTLPSNFKFETKKNSSPQEIITKNKRFVIVIPSYNNQKWCENNINSALNQNYDKYRIIFTDDCSSDNTFEKVSQIVGASAKANICTLIKNTTRLGALCNLYNMIHSCDDEEIILTLDGDDWFPDENVLIKLNNIYSKEDVWMTYGQYKNYPDGGRGIAQPYPSNVIEQNSFRQYAWGASHLRTFYAWLFKKINKEDLYYEGKFMSMAWDMAIQFPMLEMSKHHSKFISDILYIYNLQNPINDHKVNRPLQHKLDQVMRSRAKYQSCEKPIFIKSNVGLLLIATGKYDKYVQGIIGSADKYFLNDLANVTYYVFTDKTLNIKTNRNIIYIPIEHKSFPYASMDRYKHFIKNADKLDKENYLYYVDVDCLFVDNIEKEIFGDLVAVQHCGFYKKVGPYENNPKSVFYIEDTKRYKFYAGGGWQGGLKNNYLEAAEWCYNMIEKDLANGIKPIWDDETAWNRFLLDHDPNIILSPSYHFPQSNASYYKSIWSPDDFKPKILLLDKNHNEVRKS